MALLGWLILPLSLAVAVPHSVVVIAGPLANVLVAAVATGLLFALGLRPADFSAAQVQLHPATPGFVGWLGLGQVMDEMAILGISPVGWFLALLAALSLGLAVANLLPFPPLDGSRLRL